MAPKRSGARFALNDQLQALAPLRDDCVFLNGLSMGPTDSGSHPGERRSS